MPRNSIKQLSAINQTVDSGAFRIKRPIITTNGVSTAVASAVDGQFSELAQLLGKRVFGARADKPDDQLKHVRSLISLHLTPRFAPPKSGRATFMAGATLLAPAADPAGTHEGRCRSGTPVTAFATALARRPSLRRTPDFPRPPLLADFIDITPNLSSTQVRLPEQPLVGNWNSVADGLRHGKLRAATRYPGTAPTTSIAYAVLVMQVKDFNALKNFILNNQAGVLNVINYGAVSAARSYIYDQKLVVTDYNDDGSGLAAKITSWRD